MGARGSWRKSRSMRGMMKTCIRGCLPKYETHVIWRTLSKMKPLSIDVRLFILFLFELSRRYFSFLVIILSTCDIGNHISQTYSVL